MLFTFKIVLQGIVLLVTEIRAEMASEFLF